MYYIIDEILGALGGNKSENELKKNLKIIGVMVNESQSVAELADAYHTLLAITEKSDIAHFRPTAIEESIKETVTKPLPGWVMLPAQAVAEFFKDHSEYDVYFELKWLGYTGEALGTRKKQRRRSE